MPPPAPTVYFFYGDEDLAIAEAIGRMRQNLGDPSTADMNTQRFSAIQLDMDALKGACSTAPFLANRRLVILEDLEQRQSDRQLKEELPQLLESLPPTTALVLVERVSFKKSKDAESWRRSSTLLEWCKRHKESSFVREYLKPAGPGFVQWLRERCKAMGGEIEPEAAHILAEWVAENARLADKELAKLLDFVDYQRPIEAGDVERLTPYYGQADVFAMVDSVGERNAKQALALMHQLLRDEDPRYAFAMIIRQFRLLIQAREALDAGRQVRGVLSIHPYVEAKITAQAKKFSLPQLERIHHELLELDLATKTGKAQLEVGLDKLVTQLAD